MEQFRFQSAKLINKSVPGSGLGPHNREAPASLSDRMVYPRYFLCIVLLPPLIGCSGGHGTATVVGTVLYKNQPVEGATVNFLPKGETPGAKPAHGRTDSGGHFTLTTYFDPTDQPVGALPGEYSVTITKIDEPKGA